MIGGKVKVRRPRVMDLEERFESKVLPLFKRKSKELGEMLPELYLHGLSSGDFKSALLVIIAALSNREKHIVACESGERESKESWRRRKTR